MNHYKRNSGALVSTLGVAVALTMTAVVGLVATSSARQARSVSPPRIEVCAGCINVPSKPEAPALADDDELDRIDRANTHHG